LGIETPDTGNRDKRDDLRLINKETDVAMVSGRAGINEGIKLVKGAIGDTVCDFLRKEKRQ